MAVGGNRTTEPHAFSASNLVRDAVKISLGSLEAESLPAIPEPRQSAELVIDGTGKKSTVYLLGGIGPDGDITRTLGDAFRLEPGVVHVDEDPERDSRFARDVPGSRCTKTPSGFSAATSGTGNPIIPARCRPRSFAGTWLRGKAGFVANRQANSPSRGGRLPERSWTRSTTWLAGSEPT